MSWCLKWSCLPFMRLNVMYEKKAAANRSVQGRLLGNACLNWRNQLTSSRKRHQLVLSSDDTHNPLCRKTLASSKTQQHLGASTTKPCPFSAHLHLTAWTRHMHIMHACYPVVMRLQRKPCVPKKPCHASKPCTFELSKAVQHPPQHCRQAANHSHCTS